MTRLLEGDSTVSIKEMNGRERIEKMKEVPEIDQDLRELVMRCLAVLPENRPRLAILLENVKAFSTSKTADAYADISTASHEADLYIEQLVKTYVLNADT